MTVIDKPIMVNGTGRCGSTIFYSLLCEHPDLAWFSNYTSRFPRLPQLATLSRIRNLRWFDPAVADAWRITPKPNEANSLYMELTDGVFTEPRLLHAEDLTEATRLRYRSCVQKHLMFQGKSRFVQKHTGFPRYAYLSEIFPDASFIHILRDGRAVANSMINVSWWNGTLDSWWWGPMKEEYRDEFENSPDPPLSLAAIVWKTLVDYIRDASRKLPTSQYMEIRYSDLVANPEKTLLSVLEFLDLEPNARFVQSIRAHTIYNSDDKWKKSLTAEQQNLLHDSLSGHLNSLGFAG